MEKVKILLLALMVALSVNLQAQHITLENVDVYAVSTNEKWKANIYSDNTAEITGIAEPTDREILVIPEKVILPQPNRTFKVTKIADAAFNESKMKFSRLNLPIDLESIGNLAFTGCSLESLALPYGIKCGFAAFANCNNLREVKTFVLSQDIFSSCNSLTSVTLYSIDEIPDNAFDFCRSLTSISFPPNLRNIGRGAFAYSGLTSLDFSGLRAEHVSIAPYAFQRCTHLTSVKFPTKSYEIGDSAFYDCKKLGPDLNLENATIEKNAFAACSSLKGTLRLRNCTFHGSGHFSGYEFDGKQETAHFRYLDADVLSLKQLKREHFDAALSKDKNYTMTLKNGSVIAEMETIPDNFLTNMDFLRGEIKFSPQLKEIGKNAFYNCGLAANAADIPSSATIGLAVFRLAPNFTGDVVLPRRFQQLPGRRKWWNFIPFSISGITSIDFGNCPFFFNPGETINSELSKGLLWVDKTYDQNSRNLLWVDTRRCDEARPSAEGAFGSYTKFGRNKPSESTYGHFIGLEPNTLVYLPPMSVFPYSYNNEVSFDERFDTDENDDETGGNGSNFIMDEKCKQFFVKEGLSYRVPFAFTAQTARYTRTFNVTTDKAVSTLYLPYHTDLPAGMCAYTFVKRGVNTDGEKTFVFRKVPQGTRLEANTPYLVQITDGQPHKLPVMRNVEVPASPKENAAGLPGIETSDWRFCGTTEKLDNFNVLLKRAAYYLSGDKWWVVNPFVENDYIAPFRCYISAPKGVVPYTRNFFLVLEDDDNSSVTGVKQLEGETEQDIYSGKYPFYSIDGKLMGKDYNKLERGQIYIVNGKKFYKI